MSKFSLKIDQMEAFKAFLDRRAIQHRVGSGDYQVLQIKNPSGPEWFSVYTRLYQPEFYTVDHRLDSLVELFLRSIANAAH